MTTWRCYVDHRTIVDRNVLPMSDERPTPATDSEKLADKMARDILSEDVLKPKDRPVVRKALDEADAKTTREGSNDAVWRRATGRLANNWRRNPDGTSREVGWYEPGAGGAMKPVDGDAMTRKGG